MDFCHFFSSSKDFTFDFSMSHCYTRYRSEEISPSASLILGEPQGISRNEDVVEGERETSVKADSELPCT